MNSHNGSLSKLFWAEFGEFIIISVSSLKTCILDVPDVLCYVSGFKL